MSDQRFRISPQFSVIFSQHSILVCGEDENHVFEGRSFARVVETFASAGRTDHTWRETLDTESRTALAELIEKRIVTCEDPTDDGLIAYWDSLNCSPQNGKVLIQSLLPSFTDLLRYALESNGVTVGHQEDLRLIITDDYLRPEITRIDRKKPWLLAKPVGHTIWLGPLIIPGKTTCYECLALALKRNRWLQNAVGVDDVLGYLTQPSTGALRSTLAVAAGMISTAVAVFLATGTHDSLKNKILLLDTRTMSFIQSSVLPFAACSDCGSTTLSNGSSGRAFRELISPVTGVVSTLEITDSLKAGLFHATATFVHPYCSRKVRSPLRPSTSSGKGLTSVEAETSCLAEAIERYSLTYQESDMCLSAKPEPNMLVSPNDILLFSEAQFQNRDTWNKSHSELHWIPEKAVELNKVTWTKAKSLESNCTKFVPSGIVYMHFSFRNEPEFCRADTNGCAAGQTLVDALLAALLELIERDAVAIWWYNRVPRPAINLDSLGDLRLLDIRRALEREGHKVYILDLTTNLGIPAYVAVAPLPDGSMPFFGCGAHVSPRLAAFKALSELSQIWFWSKRGRASDELCDWLRTANARQTSYLQPSGEVNPVDSGTMSAEENLRACVASVIGAGIEPMYVDLTRPEIGIPVVRVLAPGLRHFWARFAPGRLYDVPVSMGWLDRRLEESNLNPIPCMI